MGAGYTLFLYVDGSDLHEVAPVLRARFQNFVERQEFVAHDVWFVEQTRTDDPTLGPEDLPDWELGLNLQRKDATGDRPANWFDDVTAVLSLAQLLSVETKRSFVLGASFEDATAEDLIFVGEGPVDIEELRVRLGGDAHARH